MILSSLGAAIRKMAAAMASMLSDTTQPARPRGVSSASIRSHPGPSGGPPWPWIRPATSSSPGRATPRTGATTGVYAQRLNAAQLQGSEFQVNTYTSNGQRFAAVAMDSAGDFVITWSSFTQDGSSYGIYAQRTERDRHGPGGRFRVNSYTSYGIDRFGRGDGFGRRLRHRLDQQQRGRQRLWRLRPTHRFRRAPWGTNSERTPTPPAIKAARFRQTTTAPPAVAMDAAGDFVAAWSSPARTAAAMASTPSGTSCLRPSPPQPARSPASSKVNTYTSGAESRSPGGGCEMPAITSSSGKVRAKTAAVRHLCPASTPRGRARQRVPGQYLHHGQPGKPQRGNGCRG